MKRYVFFTNSIRNMGGAQMYLRNKLVFLRNNGWMPTVFFYNQGDVLIPELKEFVENRIPELGFPITAINRNKREKVICKIISVLADFEECVFESHIYPECYWMEEVAKRVRGRHLLFPLHEGFPSINYNEESYILFKLKRKEFMNSTRSIREVLRKKWENNYAFELPSYSNVTAPIDYPLNYDKSYKTILSLGRLDKPYIMPMLKEISTFTEKTGLKVNLFLVGGAAEKSYIANIKSYLADKKDIIPYFLGYMFPVPECIIKVADVAIASSGSVIVPTEFGIPTIAIDTQDYMAMGIFGKTTFNTFTRQVEPQQNSSDLLYEILVEGKYCNMEARPSEATVQAEKILMEHLQIIETLDAPKEYYNVFSIFSKKEVMRQKLVMMFYKTFGEEGVVKIVKVRNMILGRK